MSALKGGWRGGYRVGLPASKLSWQWQFEGLPTLHKRDGTRFDLP
jgi:hypothetical protein